jgi:hypothetical protein
MSWPQPVLYSYERDTANSILFLTGVQTVNGSWREGLHPRLLPDVALLPG